MLLVGILVSIRYEFLAEVWKVTRLIGWPQIPGTNFGEIKVLLKSSED